MAYRANLTDDFGAVAGSAGGANAAANDAAFAAAMASPIKLIEIDPGRYEISQTVALSANAKRLVGSDGADVFRGANEGTVLEWWGGAGQMVRIAPAGQSDVIAPELSGVQLLCRNLATIGVASWGTRRMKLRNVAVLDPTVVGFHFQNKPLGYADIGSNYDAMAEALSVSATGSGGGMVFDNLSGSVIILPHVTHANGIAYYFRYADTNSFIGLNSSRIEGSTGHTIFFDGLGDYVMGNRFFGVHCGGWPIGAQMSIYSRGSKARQNRIYGLDGVDTQPIVTIEPASELYYDYQGGGYTATLVAEKALDRTPKQAPRNW